VNLKVAVATAVAAAIVLAGVTFYFMRGTETVTLEEVVKNVPMTIVVGSSAFEYGDSIPKQYAGDGENKPIPVSWRNYPEGTASFTIVMFDQTHRKERSSTRCCSTYPRTLRALRERKWA